MPRDDSGNGQWDEGKVGGWNGGREGVEDRMDDGDVVVGMIGGGRCCCGVFVLVLCLAPGGLWLSARCWPMGGANLSIVVGCVAIATLAAAVATAVASAANANAETICCTVDCLTSWPCQVSSCVLTEGVRRCMVDVDNNQAWHCDYLTVDEKTEATSFM